MSVNDPSPVPVPFHERLTKLRYKGVFDWDKLYKEMVAWAKEREFEFYETQYKHKWKGKLAEIEIKWRLEQEINSFAKNEIRVFFHMWDFKEVEVIQNGEKKRLSQARMFIDFNGALLLDWQKRFDGSKVKRLLRDFYINHIIRHEIADIWWDKLWYNANKFQQHAKRLLNIESESDVYDDMW